MCCSSFRNSKYFAPVLYEQLSYVSIEFAKKNPPIWSMSHPPLIWFVLADDATEESYQFATPTSVLRCSLVVPVVDQFRKAVKALHSNRLSSVDPSDLLVYSNVSAYERRNVPSPDRRGEPLHPTQDLGSLGSEQEFLVVVVPESVSSRAKRRQRWEKLNEALQRVVPNSEIDHSPLYSNVTWDQLKSGLRITKYVQSEKSIDDVDLDLFEQYLSVTTKCFKSISCGGDIQRLYYIAPIIMSIGKLFDGDVEISVEEDLAGKFVQGQVHFEFMLKRRDRAVCVVLARKGNLNEAMVKGVIGCEIAAEVCELNQVYAIVTDYIRWNFLRSHKDKIQFEECSLHVSPDGPLRDSLKEIVAKIYSMISD